MNDQIQDAERVAKGAEPHYTRKQYESAIFDLVEAEAQPGEGIANAYARLVEGDPRIAKLYDAGDQADAVEQRDVLAKREDKVWPMIVEVAKGRRREGETIEQATARLLEEDPTVRDAYAYSQGL